MWMVYLYQWSVQTFLCNNFITQRHKLNIQERDAMIIEQSGIFQLKGKIFMKYWICVPNTTNSKQWLTFLKIGFDSPPLTPQKVTKFVDATKELYQKLVKDGKDTKVCVEKWLIRIFINILCLNSIMNFVWIWMPHIRNTALFTSFYFSISKRFKNASTQFKAK